MKQDMNKISEDQASFLRTHRHRHRTIHLLRFLLLLLFLIFWEVCSRCGIIDVFFFSSPSGLIKCFLKQLQNNHLTEHIVITFFETIVSFFSVMFLSMFLAILLWTCELLSSVAEPFLVILNSIPKSALAPLFIVWLGANTGTIIVAGISVALFGSIINMYSNFVHTDKEKLKLIQLLGGTRKDCFFRVVLPSSLPELISIAKVNIGLSLVGVIIGEFLASRAGLGYLILYGTQIFQLDMVLLSILLLCLMAYLFYMTLQLLEHRLKKMKIYE